NASDLGAERFGDLHRERPDTARRAVDQNFLSGLNVPFVAQTLQCREPGNRNRTGLFESYICRFQNNSAIGIDADIFGDSTILRSENLVARFEVRYIFSNCFDDPGEVGAEARVFRLAQPAYWTHRPGASN